MNRYEHSMMASVSRGNLNLRPINDLHVHLVNEDFKGRYVADDREYGNVAFALVKRRHSGHTMQLKKGPKKDRGEIELPYAALGEDAKRLYELLEGSGRSYPLDVHVYDSQVLHVEWPTKANARLARRSPTPKSED